MNKWVRALCTLMMAVVLLVGLPSNFVAMVSYAAEEVVDKDDLERVIQSAEKILPNSYSASSYEVLKDAIAEAKAVMDRQDATQDEVDEAMLSVSDAIAGLKEKVPVVLFIVLGIALVFVVGSGIVFLVVRIRERRQSDFEREIIEQNSWQSQMTSVEGNRVRRTATQMDVNTQETVPQEEKTQEDILEEAGEEVLCQEEPEYVCAATTVLSQELGQTAVLYQPQPTYEPSAYLMRLRTGERIDITKPEFVLGKDYTVADYCLEGNSAISRAHAAIIQKEDGFELADKKATNGTYVNGLRVMEPWDITILDGDILKLADEEFEFHLISK